jgi:hypothetical protein
MGHTLSVVPAKAGTHNHRPAYPVRWIPAFAGMTAECVAGAE